MTDERWLDIAGFEGAYQVSDLGRVRSISRVVTRSDGRMQPIHGRILKPVAKVSSGHLYVCLYVPGSARRQPRDVHRLVLEAFVGPPPSGTEGCHNNDDRLDNRLVNLRWDTHVENMRDVVRNGNHHQKNKTHCKRGHEFTAENTRVLADGGRLCRTCAADAGRRRRERNRIEKPPITHCKRGHEFTDENTYVRPNGGRRCRKCHALGEASRKRAAAEGAAS